MEVTSALAFLAALFLGVNLGGGLERHYRILPEAVRVFNMAARSGNFESHQALERGKTSIRWVSIH